MKGAKNMSEIQNAIEVKNLKKGLVAEFCLKILA